MKKTRVVEKPWCPGKLNQEEIPEPGAGELAQQSRAPASSAEDPCAVPSTSGVALNHLLCKFQRLQCPLLAPLVTRNMLHAANTPRHKIKTNKSEEEKTPRVSISSAPEALVRLIFLLPLPCTPVSRCTKCDHRRQEWGPRQVYLVPRG